MGDSIFKDIFMKKPISFSDSFPCFGNEGDGDSYNDEDIGLWRNGLFGQHLDSNRFLDNRASAHMLSEMSRENYIVELACGPGLGFIPSLQKMNPSVPCLATDANPDVLREWNRYLEINNLCRKISFAQFSVFDIPFKNNSVQAYSSFLGLSSTKAGNKGYNKAISEVYRTLAPKGRLYTVEAEWTDISAVMDLFRKTGRPPWDIIVEAEKEGFTSWQDRFLNAGFNILYRELFEYRSLAADDNELGKAGEMFGVEVGMRYVAYILEKKSAGEQSY